MAHKTNLVQFLSKLTVQQLFFGRHNFFCIIYLSLSILPIIPTYYQEKIGQMKI